MDIYIVIGKSSVIPKDIWAKSKQGSPRPTHTEPAFDLPSTLHGNIS